jgi:hypothetical protein
MAPAIVIVKWPKTSLPSRSYCNCTIVYASQQDQATSLPQAKAMPGPMPSCCLFFPASNQSINQLLFGARSIFRPEPIAAMAALKQYVNELQIDGRWKKRPSCAILRDAPGLGTAPSVRCPVAPVPHCVMGTRSQLLPCFLVLRWRSPDQTLTHTLHSLWSPIRSDRRRQSVC